MPEACLRHDVRGKILLRVCGCAPHPNPLPIEEMGRGNDARDRRETENT
jgi:hypothetical protein